MGFLDKMKGLGKEMGIGLSAQEQYYRAYEKGVLLQPPQYGSAAKHFATASEKFLKEGNQNMAQRAQANAALYGLVDSGDRSFIPEVIQVLEAVPEIERIGSRDEMIKTTPLIAELTALQYEHQAETCDSNTDKQAVYAKAADGFMKLGTSPLQIAEQLKVNGPKDKAMIRSFYCGALSDYYAAFSVVMESPTQAHDFLQKSAAGFRQAMVTDWSKTVDDYIKEISSKSHCWMCGREMQGNGFFYRYYPAITQKFHRHLLESSNEDLRMIDTPGKVTVCTVCGSAIENQADRYATMRANEVREWATAIFENHNERINDLVRAVNRLNQMAHTH
jgi:hypothetical protein